MCGAFWVADEKPMAQPLSNIDRLVFKYLFICNAGNHTQPYAPEAGT